MERRKTWALYGIATVSILATVAISLLPQNNIPDHTPTVPTSTTTQPTSTTSQPTSTTTEPTSTTSQPTSTASTRPWIPPTPSPETYGDLVEDLHRLVSPRVKIVEDVKSKEVGVVLPKDASRELAHETARAIHARSAFEYDKNKWSTVLVQQVGETSVISRPYYPFIGEVEPTAHWDRAVALAEPVAGHYEEVRLVPSVLFLSDFTNYETKAACADHLDSTPSMFQHPAFAAAYDGEVEMYFGSHKCGGYRVFIKTMLGEHETKISALSELLRKDFELPPGTLIRVEHNGGLRLTSDQLTREHLNVMSSLWTLGEVRQVSGH